MGEELMTVGELARRTGWLEQAFHRASNRL